MGLKEFLSAREVDYISHDIANDPSARMRFAQVGGERAPAIAKAGSWIPGADLDRVAEFLGLAVEPRVPLPATVLIERLRRVLSTAIRLLEQVPIECLADKLPNRDRTVLALTNHIVEIADGLLRVAAGHPFDATVAGAIPSRELDRQELATRSRSVGARLATLRPSPAREVETQHGTSTFHLVLERSAWHAAQHTRQLAFMLRRFGIAPNRPLTATDLEGLPLPEAVWDSEPS